MGLIEPINTRITDPQYFLDSPHQGNSEFHLGSLWQAYLKCRLGLKAMVNLM